MSRVVKSHSSLSNSTTESVKWCKLNFTHIGSNLNIHTINGVQSIEWLRDVHYILNETEYLNISSQKKEENSERIKFKSY